MILVIGGSLPPPPPEEVLEVILLVILHHGGRVQGPVLAAIMGEAGIAVEAFRLALAIGDERGFFDMLGGVLLLCRDGWRHLAEKAPKLEELAA